ncbi:MAG: hypothetical protein KBD76_00975, partial [Bacteriovorax sp.]|nr:hypothetical protein [Bacteriovorax sp.]
MKKGFFCWMLLSQFSSALYAIDKVEVADKGQMVYGYAPEAQPQAPQPKPPSFYNRQCPFYNSADERFSAQIAGLKDYASREDEKDKNCRASFNIGQLNELQSAIGRYNQLMGLASRRGGQGGLYRGDDGGGLGGGRSSWSLTCFNIDQYYKEEASRFVELTKRSNKALMTNPVSDKSSVDFGFEESSGFDMGGVFPSPSQASPFDSCQIKSGEELETCVAEKRVEVVADEKHKCDRD